MPFLNSLDRYAKLLLRELELADRKEEALNNLFTSREISKSVYQNMKNRIEEDSIKLHLRSRGTYPEYEEYDEGS